jgi:hypothetical protein
MHKLDNETILLAFVALTALAILLQALILLAILVSVRKVAQTLQKDAEDMRASVRELRSAVVPFIDNSREVFARVAPRIEAVAIDVSELVYGVRVQAADIQDSATEILERLRVQTNRMDSMLTGALDAADRAGSYVATAVVKPMRQVSGVLASVRAVVQTLRSPAPERRQSSDRDR